MLSKNIEEQELIQYQIKEIEESVSIEGLLEMDKWTSFGWMLKLDRLRVIKFTIKILREEIRKNSTIITKFTC